MRKFRYILFFIISLFIYNNVYAYDTYKLDDYVYFDPITTKKCDSSNYWTLYNTNSTCYRFFNIDLDNNSDSNTLKIILGYLGWSPKKDK